MNAITHNLNVGGAALDVPIRVFWPIKDKAGGIAVGKSSGPSGNPQIPDAVPTPSRRFSMRFKWSARKSTVARSIDGAAELTGKPVLRYLS
jgi:hypothetical protein